MDEEEIKITEESSSEKESKEICLYDNKMVDINFNEELTTGLISSYYGCIYKITNMINGKGYVGQSIKINDVIDRKYQGSGKLIKRSIEKYGWENFNVEIIEYVKNDDSLDYKENQKILNKREEFHIENEGTHKSLGKGYNISWGGTAILRGEDNGMYGKFGELASCYGRTGEKHPMYGKHHSEESRKKTSISGKGKNKNKRWITDGISDKFIKEEDKIPEGWKLGMSLSSRMKKSRPGNQNCNYGKKWITDGFNYKMIKKELDIPIGWKLGSPSKGRKMTEESKLKLKESKKNISIESRRKMSESQRARPLIICQKCGLSSRGASAMKRHFKKCN